MTIYADSFLNESPARQLGALAATLARIASSAEKIARTKAVVPMMDECLQFIEWTGSRQTEAASKELQDIKMMLALWRDSWEHAHTDERLRKLLAIQTRKWSEQTLQYSGLVNR